LKALAFYPAGSGAFGALELAPFDSAVRLRIMSPALHIQGLGK
jgi:hypothetical protein